MAVCRINATREGALAPGWEPAIDAALAGLAPGAPVAVLVHGFRYTWRAETCAAACPHATLYAAASVPATRRRRPERAAWARALGFEADGGETGLAIAFGWEARIGRHGRSGFAEVYQRAGLAGHALARLIARIAGRRPDLRVDMVTHSLGARVALSAGEAAPGLPLRRLVLMGAAEYRGRAEAFLAATDGRGAAPQVCHVLSRANDPYDWLFSLVAPPPERAGDRSLGHAGLGLADPRWLDIQLDHAAVRAWLATRGHVPARPAERVSHWHFYADPGAMSFYRAILRAPHGYAVPELRAAGLPTRMTRRWSRLVPVLTGRLGGAETVPLTDPQQT